METKTEIHKRKIGSVIIFDLYGDLTEGDIDSIKDFIERNIQRGGFRNVILNAQNVLHVDQLALRKILVPLERPHRKAIYCHSPEVLEAFLNTYLPEKMKICTNEEEVSNTFGLYLVERDKFIFKGERRKNKRIEVAVPVSLQIQNTENVSATALITNMSDGGFFAECLDLESATTLRNLKEFRNMPAKATFKLPESAQEETHDVELLRIEVTSRQTGFAAKFISPLAI
jgi:anti-anti-sigma regulatory factor